MAKTTFAQRREALDKISKQLLAARSQKDATVMQLTQLQTDTSNIPTQFKKFLDEISEDSGGADCYRNMASEAVVLLDEAGALANEVDQMVKAAG